MAWLLRLLVVLSLGVSTQAQAQLGTLGFAQGSTGRFVNNDGWTVMPPSYGSGGCGGTFVGTQSGFNLTVSASNLKAFVRAGEAISGTGVAAATHIVSQTSGNPNADGVYVTDKTGTASGATVTVAVDNTGTCVAYLDNTGGQGNDATCYAAPAPNGADWNPVPGQQCATAPKSASFLRNISNDFVMAKCGTTYSSSATGLIGAGFGNIAKSGISNAQPIVFDVYGSCGNVTFNLSHVDSFGVLAFSGNNNGNHIFVRGFNSYGFDQDPSVPSNFVYAGQPSTISGQRAVGINSKPRLAQTDMTFEGNVFSYGPNCLDIEASSAPITNVVLRRNIVNDCVGGIYTSGVDNLSLIENVFNGSGGDPVILGATVQVSYASGTPGVFTWPTNVFFAPNSIAAFTSSGTYTTTNLGSGYTPGIYQNVPMTGGAGTNALATIQINGSGVVSNLLFTNGGMNFAVNDVLCPGSSGVCSNTNVGGTGSGIAVTVHGLLSAASIVCPVGDPTHGIPANTPLFVQNQSGMAPGSTFNLSSVSGTGAKLNPTASGTIGCYYTGGWGNEFVHNWYIHDNAPYEISVPNNSYGTFSSNDIGGQWRPGGPQINDHIVLTGTGLQTTSVEYPGSTVATYTSAWNVLTEGLSGVNVTAASGMVGQGVTSPAIGNLVAPVTLGYNFAVGTVTPGDAVNVMFTCTPSPAFVCPAGFPTSTSTVMKSSTFTATSGAGPIATLSGLAGGSLYVAGTYSNVPLTGGSGSGATASIVVNVGGAVSSATLVSGGTGYNIGDVLSASNSNLGGAGSGFSINVATSFGLTVTGTTDIITPNDALSGNACVPANALISSQSSGTTSRDGLYLTSLGTSCSSVSLTTINTPTSAMHRVSLDIAALTPWVAYGMVGATAAVSYTSGAVAVFTYPRTLDFPAQYIFHCTTSGPSQDGIVGNADYFAVNLNTGAKTFNLSTTRGGTAITTTGAGTINCAWSNFIANANGGLSDPRWVQMTLKFGPSQGQIGVTSSVTGAGTEVVTTFYGTPGSVTIDHNLVFNYSNPATGGISTLGAGFALEYDNGIGGSLITNNVLGDWGNGGGPSYVDRSIQTVTGVAAGADYGSGVTPRVSIPHADTILSIYGQGPVSIAGVNGVTSAVNGAHYAVYVSATTVDLLDSAGQSFGTFTSSPSSTFSLGTVAPNVSTGNSIGSGIGNNDLDTLLPTQAATIGGFLNLTDGEYVNFLGLGATCGTQINGTIVGTNLTVNSTVSGALAMGMSLGGTGVSYNRVVSGSGAAWVVSQNHSVGPVAMSACNTQDLVKLMLNNTRFNWNGDLRVCKLNDFLRNPFGVLLPQQGCLTAG